MKTHDMEYIKHNMGSTEGRCNVCVHTDVCYMLRDMNKLDVRMPSVFKFKCEYFHDKDESGFGAGV